MFAQGIRQPQFYIPTCNFLDQCFLKVTQRLRPHIHSQSHQGPLGKNYFEIDQIKNGAVVTMISTDNDPQI